MATSRDQLGTLEAEGSSGHRGYSGVEVVLSSDPATPAPLCPHGGSASGLSLAVWRQGAWLAWGCLGHLGLPNFYLPLSPTEYGSRRRSFLWKLCFSTYLRNLQRSLLVVILAPSRLRLFWRDEAEARHKGCMLLSNSHCEVLWYFICWFALFLVKKKLGRREIMNSCLETRPSFSLTRGERVCPNLNAKSFTEKVTERR